MVVCLEQGADLHMAQLMPLPLTVSCFSKIQMCFTFLVPAHLDSPGQRAIKQMCVCEGMCNDTLTVSLSYLLQLLDVSIVKDQKTGQSQGFAFLTVSFVCV